MFNTREAIKFVTGLTTAICVGHTTGQIIGANTNTEETAEKIQVGIASFVVGGMAGTAAWNYTDQYVDQVADGVAKIRENHKIAKEAKKAEKAAAAEKAANN